jgi:hypothetical protein
MMMELLAVQSHHQYIKLTDQWEQQALHFLAKARRNTREKKLNTKGAGEGVVVG